MRKTQKNSTITHLDKERRKNKKCVQHLALTNAAAQITLAQRASAVTSCLAESDVFVFATPKIAKVIIATLIETLVDKARFFVDKIVKKGFFILL